MDWLFTLGAVNDPLLRHTGALAICLALALCCGTSSLAGAQGSGAPSAATITEISLERGCFGCPTGSVLVLHRDGHATYTVTGNARQGTEDKGSVGTVPAEDFDKLARLISSKRFFDLNDQYDTPEIKDGAWTTTSVTRGGEVKQVFRRDDVGPAPLKAIEQAIDASKARIEFIPSLR